VFTEEDWNSEDTLESNAYPYSKTMAERAAWDFMASDRPGFDLVSINPVQVIGPTLVPRVNQTHEWFTSLTDGSSPVVVAMDFPTVDVRDVAQAHILAMETPAASGRYLTSAGNMTLRRVAEIGRRLGLGEKYRIPSITLDSRAGIALSRFALLFQPAGTRRYLRKTIGQTYNVDTTKVRRDLKIDFRDLDKSIEETWIDLERWGMLGKISV
jgi:dihydroflavonol-4-reductase